MTKHILENKFLPVIIFILTCLFTFFSNLYAAEYVVTQLTDNEYDDYYPQIDNGQVAWESWDDYGSKILFYDGVSVVSLTGNGYAFGPRINNGQVVWSGYDDNYLSSIFYYDNKNVNQITHGTDNWGPDIHDGLIAWCGYNNDNYLDIFLYDGSQAVQIKHDDYWDYNPRIDNGQVVWTANDHNFLDLFLYNGTKIIQLTNDSNYEGEPQISNGQVVWDNGRGGVFFYDGNKTIQFPGIGAYPDIHNGQVAWNGWDGHHYQIFLYDGVQSTKLTNSNYDNYFPQIYNGQVAWNDWDGHDYEIFLYDGAHTIRLTDNNYNDYFPQIHNGQVAWYGYDGHDYEVFLAKPVSVTPQPTLGIFDGSDFSAGRDVTTDIEQIVSTIKSGQAAAVEGAATDGVARLLLAVDVPQSGSVKFSLLGTGNSKEDGVLRVLGGFQEGNILDVSTVTTTEGEKAFCIYQAPEDFVRKSVDNNHDGKPDDETVSERTISLKVEYNNSTPVEKQIKLIRPSLVLIHGLWTGPGMWSENDFLFNLISHVPGIHVFMIDYEERNASHFADNKDVPYSCKGNSLSSIRGVYKNTYKIAMVQADVLGYSMGGVLARIYAGVGEGTYERENNFYEGDINKLITLDTPHYGSFLADAGIACLRGPHSLSAHIFLQGMEMKKYSLAKGAVEDLMTTSEPIKKMNTIEVKLPCHTIIGDYNGVDVVSIVPYSQPDDSKDFMVTGLPADYSDLHNKLIQEGYGEGIISNLKSGSDIVVSIDSQIGGLTLSGSETFDHHHMAVTTQNVINRVIELINASSDEPLFNSGFIKN